MREETRAEILSIVPYDDYICVGDINARTTFVVRTVHTYLKLLLDEGLIKKAKRVTDMRKTFYRRIK